MEKPTKGAVTNDIIPEIIITIKTIQALKSIKPLPKSTTNFLILTP